MNAFRQAEKDAAARANDRIRQESIAYHSTTAPLNQVNDNLKEIKIILNEILDLLNKRV